MKNIFLIVILTFLITLSSCGSPSIANYSSTAISSSDKSLPLSISDGQTGASSAESISSNSFESTVSSLSPSPKQPVISPLASTASKVISSGVGNSSSTSTPTEKAIQFSDPILEKLLRDCIKKPTGTCYPSDFREISRIQDDIYIHYSNDNLISFGNMNPMGVRASAAGWPTNFSVLSQIPIRNFKIFYLTPSNSINTVNFDISWIASSKELISFVYKDMEQLENKNHPRRMIFTNFNSLSSCTKLELLYLWNCQGVKLDSILNLRNIKVLSLKNCGITSVAGIQNFTKLWKLELDYNNINDISALEYHPALKELYLTNVTNPIDVKTLLTIPYLETLYLKDCVPLTSNEKRQLDLNNVKLIESYTSE